MIFSVNKVTKPLSQTLEILDRISEGDLSITIDDSYKTKDEIGRMMTALDTTIIKLTSIISDVVNKAYEIENVFKEVQVSMNNLIVQTDETSSTVQELAAGMEQTAASAEEIRKLAEQSKCTVSEIQNVTSVVIESVRNLSTSSEKILTFIDSQVLNDYEEMVNTGENYNRDSKFIGSFVTSVGTDMDELSKSMQGIIAAINEVTTTVNEGAHGTQSISQKTYGILENINSVNELVTKSTQNTEKLKEVVSIFKI